MSNTHPCTPRLFVISLERHNERKAAITSQLKKIKINFEFVTAYDGSTLSEHDLAQYDEKYVISNISRPLSRSEIGCYLSHRKVWQRLVDEDLSWAVVIEDDVLIQDGLTDILSAIGTLPFSWDFIRLAGLIATPVFPLCNLTENFKLAAPLQGASGTQANCISKSGAEKLLAYSTRIRGTVDDHVVDNCWKNGLKILAVQPYPIREDKVHSSSLQKERKDMFQIYRNSSFKRSRSIKEKLINRRYKLNRSIGRRAYYLIHLLLSLQIKWRNKAAF